MKTLVRTILFLSLVSFGSQFVVAQDTDGQNEWRSWRGPNADGHANEDQTPPTEWGPETNVIWKTPVPGRGHASPTIVGDKILLATADETAKTQSVVAFSRESGEQLWKTEIHQGKFATQQHPKNTHASQTVVSDGQHAFVVFFNGGGVWVTALTLDGEEVWRKETGKYRSERPFGFGTSPVLQDGKLFVTSESNAEGFILALNPADGEELYRIKRPSITSYSVPVVATVAGKRQVLMSGCNNVAGYDAETGEELWKVAAKWEVSCGTMVWDGDLVFASGGYPAQQTLAVRADGSGEVVWQNPVKVYEQSMIVVDGYLYGQSERGVLFCWRCTDGKEMWKSRTKSPESASPVLAGGNLYFTNEMGATIVIKPNHEEFELVAKNQLGSSTFASMTMLDNRIYTRIATGKRGNQKGWLYCLGEE